MLLLGGTWPGSRVNLIVLDFSTVSSGSHFVGNNLSKGLEHVEEAKMFGPRKPSKPSSKPSLVAVDEKVLKLREILPPTMVKEALKKPKVLKAVFAEVDKSAANELQMRLA